MGEVVRNHSNKTHASWLVASPSGGFAKEGNAPSNNENMALDKFNVNYELIETKENHGPWLKGRGAEIIVSGTKIGEIGEIDLIFPKTLN